MPFENDGPIAVQPSDGQFIDSGITDHLMGMARSLIDRSTLQLISGSQTPAAVNLVGSVDAVVHPVLFRDEVAGNQHPSDMAPADEAVPVTPVQSVDMTSFWNNFGREAQQRQIYNFERMMGSADAEGRRQDVYLDSEGIPTVGIGHKVLPSDHLKVGDVILPDRVESFFQKDGATALEAAQRQAAKVGISDQDFIPHLASVNLQLGRRWGADFKKTWALIKARKYDAAAVEAAHSRWNTQTPKRVQQFQDALRTLAPKATP
jgi:GH24 family phage-related lysozyme (muramidase)